MKCSFCGSENPQGAMKCTVCGSPLTAAEPNAPAVPHGHVRCPGCGAALPAGTRFCTQCGTSISGISEEKRAQLQQEKDDFWNEVTTEAEEQEKDRKKDRAIGWLLKLAGLAAAAVLIRYSIG